MRRCHAMPFGAEVGPAGTRFRLWAPAAGEVSLCLEDGSEQALRPAGAGWHELTTGRASIGSRYLFAIDGGLRVPDPASRFNPDDVHGASEVIDPRAFVWEDAHWRGRPWHEAVVYELHVGSFSEEGSFAGVERRLGELAETGVTAIELMPVADFPGARNWGYDGVLPFAPDAGYGRPEDLKRLVQSAHRHGLMVLLDVVYNHFGPEGNYLHVYAPQFFTERHQTPWGAAINFDDEGSRVVRDYYIHNALYWLEEYHLDGLRLDAVHAIRDESAKHILAELAEAVRHGVGRARHVHLVLENENNNSSYLELGYDAQWNDDLHHAFHVVLTGEADGYYSDYAREPHRTLARCLAEGFAYQGEHSAYHDAPRGEPSAQLPPTRFVGFVQNHDQIGNRAFGERLTELSEPAAVRAALAILLLMPSPPLLFMGEEWATQRRFPFFCDFGPELASAVTDGRRREFARFARFQDPQVRESIPDPNAPETFALAVLDWAERDKAEHARALALTRELLVRRSRELVPRLAGTPGGAAEYALFDSCGVRVSWRLGDGSGYHLRANLGSGELTDCPTLPGRTLYASDAISPARLPPWSVHWTLESAGV